METEASSSTSLRHRLRATVCCCFGYGGGAGGLAERMQWRRRAGVGEFRYDPLSYALNFDEGEDDEHGDADADAADHADGLLYRSFSSRLPPSPQPQTRARAAATTPAAVAVA